jgi:hypothetical protein
MSARIALAFRAKAALLAASPAFAEGSNGSWADAADYNGELLDMIGGASGLATQGNTWYKNADEINNLTGGSNPPEMIWRNGKDATAYALEQAQFPPSLYGSGQINPTQNLVDASLWQTVILLRMLRNMTNRIRMLTVTPVWRCIS